MVYTKLNVIVCILFLALTINSCKEDSVTPPTGPEAKSISGTITFADTNIIQSGGYYDVSAFPRSGWPPMAGPTQNDSLIITKVNNKYQASYKLQNLPDGEYVITSAWIKLPYNPATSTYGLGLYGCDTSHSFSCIINSPGTVTITNSQGLEDVNFLSWADTTKRTY